MDKAEILESIGIKLRGFFHFDPESSTFATPEYHLWYCVFMRHIDDYLGGHGYAEAGRNQHVESNRLNALQFIFSHESTNFGIDRDWFIELCVGAKCELGLQ
jgi:hypothetical protein